MDKQPAEPKVRLWIRGVIVGILLISMASYSAAIVCGKIPKDNRLGMPELTAFCLLGLLALLLLRPGTLSRLTHFELLGIKIDLREMKLDQEEQKQEIKAISVILPLLIPETERSHLRNLAKGGSSNYTANDVLRKELRRLCSVDLIERTEGHTISELKDNLEFRLSDYVRLTELGSEWVERLALLKTPSED